MNRLLFRARSIALVVVAAVLASGSVRADSVAQVQTAKRISRDTVAIIDPERGTSTGTVGSNVRVAPGDILTFIFQFTPVPNGAVRGLGGYITEYVPPNTEVVGARIIDRNGNTVFPHRGGLAADGWGPRGSHNYPAPLVNGSMSQLYADTGIFFSTDLRTARNPSNQLITVNNGILMNPAPTGAGQLTGLLGVAGPVFAHNQWDWVQVMAFGTNGAVGTPPGGDVNTNGQGNTPFGYGSAVAGPLTFYRYEATESGTTAGFITAMDPGVVGPWQRIRTPGAETGVGMPAASSGNVDGSVVRVGVPTSAGWDLSVLNPLPRATNAVRYAVGELVAGDEYFAEISIRVLALPLDPGLMENANCAEVFGGDASARALNSGGKDNTWRYYVPSPACVALDLLFELNVDKILAVNGEFLTYTITGKNLSTLAQTNVVITDTLAANVTFVSATGGATAAGGVITWPTIATWLPSATFTATVVVQVTGGGASTLNRASYTSTQRPAPGFSTVALTDLGQRAIIRSDLAVVPVTATAPGTVTMTATIQNIGNGPAAATGCAAPGCMYSITLPPGFSIVAGTSTINGAVVADPTLSFGDYRYTAGIAGIPALTPLPTPTPGVATLQFNVAIAAGTPNGVYTSCVGTWLQDTGFGQTINDSFCQLGAVAVGLRRAAAPTVTGPITAGSACVSGTSTEPNGTVVRVLVNGIDRGTATVMGGVWSLCGLPPLFAGQQVTATAELTGTTLPSAPSAPVTVSVPTAPACSDGIDNDGDGLTDWPADPGCTGTTDPDETNVLTECTDGIDNDADGLTDYADNGCCPVPDPNGVYDTTELGGTQCQDTVDNDGDALVDLADTGCSSAATACAINLAACQDRIDNDLDGLTDFPADLGCNSAIDNDETTPIAAPDTRPRILLIVDTSGSMTFDVTGLDSLGDGSLECPTTPSDLTRISRVRRATTDVINAFGEPVYALMRFRQSPRPFSCTGLFPAGGWDGAGATCGPLNAGELLVGFAPDNMPDLLRWMNGTHDYAGPRPPPGFDTELRGTGATPLAGSLRSAYDYVNIVRLADPRVLCRPYRVVLLTDGAETCEAPANAPTAAATLFAAGVPVTVIGFAAMALQTQLNAIAAAGGTGQAVMVDNSAALSAVLAGIVSSSILVERCNGLDDNCNGVTDEGFPALGTPCTNGQYGACARTGTNVCATSGTDTVCDAPAVSTAGLVEVCNGIDDNCNRLIDEGLMGCMACPGQPEVCNGIDDNCNGMTDEGFVSTPCGVTVGICTPGNTVCAAGVVTCTGGTQPVAEICNGLDDNCDGITDGLTRPCYTGTTGCDLTAGSCVGACRLGFEVCQTGVWGTCMGEVLPMNETCNCLDDNCNGATDDGATCAGGAACNNCSCATACNPALEFPCPGGFICVDRFCVPDPCAGVQCTAGMRCNAGQCVDACVGVTCPADMRCSAGRCVDNTCASNGCPIGQACVNRMCVTDRCMGSACPAGQACSPTTGLCSANMCGGATCPTGQVCDPTTGQCGRDPCLQINCASGMTCIAGACVTDQCAGVRCPADTVCSGGFCVSPIDGGRNRVIATGGGGCACRAAPGRRNGSNTVAWLTLAAAAIVLQSIRRNRRSE